MTITVVTGAAGHVGGVLVRALQARGRAVRALVHHDRRALERLVLETVAGDVRDPASLRRAFAGADVVYHAAAHISLRMNDGQRLHAVNVLGTRNVVEACLHAGVRRLIHFSSIHALQQEPLDVPVDESRPRVDERHAIPYDRSKAAAEREVERGLARGLDAVILNPTAIVGPHDYRPSHFGAVLLALSRGRLPALVTGGFDWVDVRDVVAGAIRAEERAAAGARYLLSGHWASAREVAALVERAAGTPAPRLVFPLALAHLGAPFATAWANLAGRRPLYTTVSLRTLRSNQVIDHRRATEELDYHPRPLQKTIADTVQWLKESGLCRGH